PRRSHSFPTRRSSDLQIYKRFEERWAHNLDKKKIYQGTGTFRSFMMKQPYVPCKEVTYYVHGDMEIIRELIEKYLVGLGNDVRIDRKSTRLNSSHVKI